MVVLQRFTLKDSIESVYFVQNGCYQKYPVPCILDTRTSKNSRKSFVSISEPCVNDKFNCVWFYFQVKKRLSLEHQPSMSG